MSLNTKHNIQGSQPYPWQIQNIQNSTQLKLNNFSQPRVNVFNMRQLQQTQSIQQSQQHSKQQQQPFLLNQIPVQYQIPQQDENLKIRSNTNHEETNNTRKSTTPCIQPYNIYPPQAFQRSQTPLTSNNSILQHQQQQPKLIVPVQDCQENIQLQKKRVESLPHCNYVQNAPLHPLQLQLQNINTNLGTIQMQNPTSQKHILQLSFQNYSNNQFRPKVLSNVQNIYQNENKPLVYENSNYNNKNKNQQYQYKNAQQHQSFQQRSMSQPINEIKIEQKSQKFVLNKCENILYLQNSSIKSPVKQQFQPPLQYQQIQQQPQLKSDKNISPKDILQISQLIKLNDQTEGFLQDLQQKQKSYDEYNYVSKSEQLQEINQQIDKQLMQLKENKNLQDKEKIVQNILKEIQQKKQQKFDYKANYQIKQEIANQIINKEVNELKTHEINNKTENYQTTQTEENLYKSQNQNINNKQSQQIKDKLANMQTYKIDDIIKQQKSQQYGIDQTPQNLKGAVKVKNVYFGCAQQKSTLASNNKIQLLNSSFSQNNNNNENEQETRKKEEELSFQQKKHSKKHQLDNYQLIKQIGSGKFKTVYKAIDKSSENQNEFVALSIIKKQTIQNYKSEEYIKNEILINQILDHPNIIKILGNFEDIDNIYLVHEYAEGGELYKLLKSQKNSRFSEKQTKIYIKQILNALVYMKEFNVIHRDIKPENILLDINGNLKIADFGCARQCQDEQRETFCGTLDYVSPEMIKGNQYTNSVDIWSLGILTYELMIGDTPFKANTFDQTFESILTHKLNFPSFVSSEAQQFIQKILVKDPKFRISVHDLQKDSYFQ